jgi:hypothetical protein
MPKQHRTQLGLLFACRTLHRFGDMHCEILCVFIGTKEVGYDIFTVLCVLRQVQ